MLPLNQSLETIKSFTTVFKERRDSAIRNTNPSIVDAATIIYNTINNQEEFGIIIEDELLRNYTDEFDEMFQMDEEPQEIKVKNSGILDPTTGSVNMKSELVMGYWFHPTTELMKRGLKEMAFIPAIFIGNMETDCDTESMGYTSQFINKDKATIMFKLDNRYNVDSQYPPTLLMAECIDCQNTDEFYGKITNYCNLFKETILSLRDLTPVESIQIFENLSGTVGALFQKMHERAEAAKKLMTK